MDGEKVLKKADETCGPFAFTLEGIEDGYRVTVRVDRERLWKHRRVGASFLNFLAQADKAGWWIPWPWRSMLRFWNRYSGRAAK